jgi:hypothetical protein
MSRSRRRRLGLLLLGPAVLAGAAISAVEGWRLARPRAPWFAPRETFTIADAIEEHDVARAYALLRQSGDPDDLIVVRHAELTAGRERFVSPLWWAVAMQDEHTVLMLIEAGATVRHTEGRDADCLAAALGRDAILAVLRRYAAPPDGPCGASSGDAVPLLQPSEKKN